jgi:hypothetical protein
MSWLFPILLATSAALADEAATPVTPAAPAATPAAAAVETPSEPNPAPTSDSTAAPVAKPRSKVRRGAREKEAEGTQAPNRFEADTVIKSQYKLDGQPLEVDPD